MTPKELRDAVYRSNDPRAREAGLQAADAWEYAELKHLQELITSWGQRTFNNPSPLALAVRGNKEMAELVSHLLNKPEEKAEIAEECADVAFFLLQICDLLGFDLQEEIKKKFNINTKRSWQIAADGSFQHEE